VGEKRRFRDACDTGWGEAAEGGAGGEKLKVKRPKETKYQQEGLQGKGKGEAVEERKRPVSAAGTAGKAKSGEGNAGEHLRVQPPLKPAAKASASITAEGESANKKSGDTAQAMNERQTGM
jgi:hypothetical protein